MLLYLLLLWLQLTAVGVLTARSPRDWGLPEWTINYSGGFIRRGLTGELLLPLSHVTHIPMLFLAAMIGIVAYALLYVSTARLLQQSSWRWWVYALALCPASFAFPVMSRTSFRKDILFMAGLAGLILWLQKHGRNSALDVWLGLTLTVVLPGLVLSQEPLFMYLPYVVAAVLMYTDSLKRTTAMLLLPLVLSAAALLAVAKHSGTPQQTKAICASVGMADNCPGGILINGKPPDSVPLYIRSYGYLRHYPAEFALALVPIVAGLVALRRPASKQVRWLCVFAGLAFAGSLAVFFYGTDWGRWINLHITSVALLVLALDGLRPRNESSPARTSRQLLPAAAVAVLLVVYATCWSVPGNRDRPLYGYLSLGEKLLHWHGSFTD